MTMETDRDEVVWLHTEHRVSLAELAEVCGLPASILEELVEYGALVPAETAGTFAVQYAASIREAARLCADLDLELPAMALVLRFLERIHGLETEVRHLQAQLPR